MRPRCTQAIAILNCSFIRINKSIHNIAWTKPFSVYGKNKIILRQIHSGSPLHMENRGSGKINLPGKVLYNQAYEFFGSEDEEYCHFAAMFFLRHYVMYLYSQIHRKQSQITLPLGQGKYEI